MDVKKALGTIIEFKESSSWLAIGGLLDISGPSVARETIDVTDHDAYSTNHRSHMGSLVDGGEVTAEMNWDPENVNQQKLRRLIKDGSENGVEFRIRFPGTDGTAISSGTLTEGKRYEVTDAGTDADFSAAGGPEDPTLADEFVATGTSATWGSPAAELTPIPGRIYFTAIPTSFEVGAPVEGKLTVNVGMKINGEVKFDTYGF